VRLLDTHVLLEILQSTLRAQPSKFEQHLRNRQAPAFASVCSLWEVSIKVRLGKLEIGLPLDKLADYFESLGLAILPIDRHHAVTYVDPEPVTRDPFDRMLLAQCKAEGLQLVTLDRVLTDHPLAWRESEA
jgi:PIN domain nuclease of toxin-antitoxin system